MGINSIFLLRNAGSGGMLYALSQAIKGVLMPFWTKDKSEKQTFSGLIRGLQYSVNAAMDMLEARNLELLSRYFTEEGHPRVRWLARS